MKGLKYIAWVTIMLLLLSACGRAVDDAKDYTSSIEDIHIPNQAKIIGLGEATHGNVELQALKKDVFEVMVEQGVRVFVLEADFGGGQVVNDYILHDKGSAQEAIKSLDFGIYKTAQMMDLVEWMHDYNEKADEDDQVYFYGNDMQRYDESKTRLLAYLDDVDEEAAKTYEEKLADATNENMHNLGTDELSELSDTMDALLNDLDAHKKDYVKSQSEEAYILAKQYATVLKQRIDLSIRENDYGKARDEYLAGNLEWITDFEAANGHDQIFVTAHNGHIEKTSATIGTTSMGDLLDETYGEAYFAIGTEVRKSTFLSNTGTGERKNFTVKNNTPLTKAFSKVDENIFYVDLDQANEPKDLGEIMSTEQKMTTIGDDFRYWYKFLKFFYTNKMIPNQAYDGLIIVQEANPTEVQE